MTQRLAIGIGYASRATLDDLLTLIHGCVVEIAPGTILTTLNRHSDSRSHLGKVVADTLGLQLMLFSADTLAQATGVKSYSSMALRLSGTPSVAEASALSALGPEARLSLPRQTGRFCTCAVAVLP